MKTIKHKTLETVREKCYLHLRNISVFCCLNDKLLIKIFTKMED